MTNLNKLIKIDEIIENLKTHLKQEYKNTLILTVTEFGRTIKQNGGLGTEHGYGTAIFMAGGLLKKSQVYTDWPGLKKKELFQGRDLNSTIDARSVYASAMSTVFDLDTYDDCPGYAIVSISVDMSEELVFVLDGEGYDHHWDPTAVMRNKVIWEWPKELSS